MNAFLRFDMHFTMRRVFARESRKSQHFENRLKVYSSSEQVVHRPENGARGYRVASVDLPNFARHQTESMHDERAAARSIEITEVIA